MVYAFAVDGYDWEQREAFDDQLTPNSSGKPSRESQAKAQRERHAQDQLMAAMGKAGRG